MTGSRTDSKQSSGTINGVPYCVPEGYAVVSDAERRRGAAASQLLSDLDRSAVGRHRGDVESQDPTGVSQGNPISPPGTHIGYTLYGARIVVPENPRDIDAWIETSNEPRTPARFAGRTPPARSVDSSGR